MKRSLSALSIAATIAAASTVSAADVTPEPMPRSVLEVADAGDMISLDEADLLIRNITADVESGKHSSTEMLARLDEVVAAIDQHLMADDADMDRAVELRRAAMSIRGKIVRFAEVHGVQLVGLTVSKATMVDGVENPLDPQSPAATQMTTKTVSSRGGLIPSGGGLPGGPLSGFGGGLRGGIGGGGALGGGLGGFGGLAAIGGIVGGAVAIAEAEDDDDAGDVGSEVGF